MGSGGAGEESKKTGKPKANYMFEVMSEQEEKIMSAFRVIKTG